MNQSPAQAAPLHTLNAGDAERLRHFPVPLFAIVMGIAGLALAWQRFEIGLAFSRAP